MSNKIKITFKPKQVTKKFLTHLPERSRDVVMNRLGLGDDSDRKTLEAIGKSYGITRERVRQIENTAFHSIRKSKSYEQEGVVFLELKDVLKDLGGVIGEEELLNTFSKDRSIQNHVHFLLILSDAFDKHKEDSFFVHRWSIDKKISDDVHNALRNLHDSLNEDDLIPEEEMIKSLQSKLETLKEEANREHLRRWLAISKIIRSNPLNDWGLAHSPNVNVRGIRDYAFLVIRRHGSPMHFTEVARAITEMFGRSAHTATCHNELIKDKRFVLVGRGLYALAEWGYASGVVRDVIREVLEKHGPLTREQIIEKVLKERYVKENTVFVNLQDPDCFKRLENGTYLAV